MFNQMYRKYFKSLLDWVIILVSIVVLMPIFLIISIAIKIDSKGPILFTQTRVGQHSKTFKIIKFRTMLTFEESFNEDGTPIENYSRITTVGNILRKTSLDELPQIFNIFKGEMSLVGPRPTLEYQVRKYTKEQFKRLEVKPGLTGRAQINGRNNISWEKKIEYDIQYVEELSFWNDLLIIIKTFSVLIKADDNSFTEHDKLSEHSGDVFKDVNK